MSAENNHIKIVFIGAGNLATQVAKKMNCSNGIDIIQVYSKTESSAQALSEILQCPFTTDLQSINEEADIYLFSVKDAVLEEVLKQVKPNKGIWAHTAGSLPMSVITPYAERYGVFYPLQTFSKTKEIELEQVPFFIEGSSKDVEDTLLMIAQKLSTDVRCLTSEQRKEIHLAAVFVCNFVNHMYSIAADILESKNIPFDVLLPLINETTSKLAHLHPKQAQTGPAVRYDQNVINKHIDMLPDKYKDLYSSISKSIYKMYSE